MNPRRVLNATFWAAIGIQTLGAVDLLYKKGELRRKLPAPKSYVAIVVVWVILGWVAQISDNLARAAAALSGLILLTTLFVNTARPERYTTAGTRLVHFFNYIGDKFAPPAPSGTPGAGGGGPTPPAPKGEPA